MSDEPLTRQDLREDWQDPELDQVLRHEFAREQAPLGFSARVEALLQQRGEHTLERWPRRKDNRIPPFLHASTASTKVRFAAAAALLLAFTVSASWRLHQQARAARGEAARQEVLLALHITGRHLRSVQQHTHTINIRFEGESQ